LYNTLGCGFLDFCFVIDLTICLGLPGEPLMGAIVKSFGSFDAFKKKFSDVAAGHFGSGWAWLVQDKSSGELRVVDTHDAGNPLLDSNLKPLLTCDVWEHAYYIDYRNARPKYIEGNEFYGSYLPTNLLSRPSSKSTHLVAVY
jgi:Fe-Mn family superoxide dismutase